MTFFFFFLEILLGQKNVSLVVPENDLNIFFLEMFAPLHISFEMWKYLEPSQDYFMKFLKH